MRGPRGGRWAGEWRYERAAPWILGDAGDAGVGLAGVASGGILVRRTVGDDRRRRALSLAVAALRRPHALPLSVGSGRMYQHGLVRFGARREREPRGHSDRHASAHGPRFLRRSARPRSTARAPTSTGVASLIANA